MGSVAYLVLGLVLVLVVLARPDRRVRAAFAALRAGQEATNEATAAAVGAVQRQLEVGPLPVTVRGEWALRGRRLVLDTGDVVLRLHLYGGSDVTQRGSWRHDPAGTGPGTPPLFLTRLADEPDRGWRVTLAGLAGTSTFEGWLLERRDIRAGSPGRRSTAGAADPEASDPTTSRRSTSPWGGAG